MAEDILKVLYNSTAVKDIPSFVDVNRTVTETNKRQVCFVVMAGVNDTFVQDILYTDRQLNSQMNSGKVIYIRIEKLSRTLSFEDTVFYTQQYEDWLKSDRKILKIKTVKSNLWSYSLGNALKNTLTLFAQTRTVNPSLAKNFAVKLLFWFDSLFTAHTQQLQKNIPVKVVAQNIIKVQEYLFFYMLTQAGCNVMLLQSEKDIETIAENLKLSHKTVIGSYSKIAIPQYTPQKAENPKSASVSDTEKKFVVVIPPRKERRKSATQKQNPPTQSVVSQPSKVQTTPPVVSQPPKVQTTQPVEQEDFDRTIIKRERKKPQRKEKSFEELALLAKSVVMIAVHDKKGDIIGLGSGIIIGKDGYILTNNHVAKGGAYYSVHMEDDDNTYMTDEVIKYHSLYDLAVIRIDKDVNPIPIYKGRKELVRGQKVVAIGSPLGLFNSVSDGIISGFREVRNGVQMIQFTAPISSGSSGGAVLNLYGEVIGISTAGIVEGQNINLAMDYKYINDFLKGLV